jgi:2-iminobutanoate/2-iminopropanoate deaminase
MRFIRTRADMPLSAAVVWSGPALEAVLTGIPPGEKQPIAGGPAAEMSEIFRQLDAILEAEGLSYKNICSVRLYLADVERDISAVNAVWKQYMKDHAPNRRAYGVVLQRGMLVEAAFTVEVGSA